MIKNNVSLLIGMRKMTIAETARLAGNFLYHNESYLFIGSKVAIYHKI